jgi:RimJ/RimL family protein N-acetyltransferase
VPDLIVTNRLGLYLISASDLILLFETPGDVAIYEGKPFSNPHRVLVDDPGPLHWRVPQVKGDPSLNIWFVRWIVLNSTHEIIGSVSFHAPPDARGMIEIGVGIHQNFRNNGYAQEALLGMWSWAINEPAVQTLRYTVSADNIPSVKIIKGFGFNHVGQQIDEADGIEEIFEIDSEVFRRRFEIPGDH